VSCAPRSTLPGPAGFVRHVSPAGTPPYWLGVCATPGPEGIDSESNGKTNSTGAPISACGDIAIDCVQAAFGMNFGQDECTGGVDAGIAAALTFKPCAMESVTFTAWNCGATSRQVVLNVLVDMNEDGDWNDNLLCGTQCAYEWAVKNVVVVLPPGCTTLRTPAFLVGPLGTQAHGYAWMRITISDTQVPTTSRGLDRPISSRPTSPWWAARARTIRSRSVTPRIRAGATTTSATRPEGLVAYPGGVVGNFPTCTAGGPAGARDTLCAAISTRPAPRAGYVKHVSSPGDAFKAWFGCAACGPRRWTRRATAKVNRPASAPVRARAGSRSTARRPRSAACSRSARTSATAMPTPASRPPSPSPPARRRR
jgi:hypothetical protein